MIRFLIYQKKNRITFLVYLIPDFHVESRRYDQHDDRGNMDKGNIRNRLGQKRVGFDVGPRGGGIQKQRNHRDNRDNKTNLNNKYHVLAGNLIYHDILMYSKIVAIQRRFPLVVDFKSICP